MVLADGDLIVDYRGSIEFTELHGILLSYHGGHPQGMPLWMTLHLCRCPFDQAAGQSLRTSMGVVISRHINESTEII